ncbi:hypothetical protein RIB2604_02500730 [Aspergillus luchuensis]|uniref:Uncharacterized protein n=1 Tax=Aspergillus kawachii TaxID=1069201 RepID=A0A146FQW6_ASPKA|nr:hypothetical protein RIB2604_02500730 [Aspergillus luchuensis]
MRSIIWLSALIGLAIAAPGASIPEENDKREWLDGYGGGGGDGYGGGGSDGYGLGKREWLDGYGRGGGDGYGGGGGDGYGLVSGNPAHEKKRVLTSYQAKREWLDGYGRGGGGDGYGRGGDGYGRGGGYWKGRSRIKLWNYGLEDEY